MAQPVQFALFLFPGGRPEYKRPLVREDGRPYPVILEFVSSSGPGVERFAQELVQLIGRVDSLRGVISVSKLSAKKSDQSMVYSIVIMEKDVAGDVNRMFFPYTIFDLLKENAQEDLRNLLNSFDEAKRNIVTVTPRLPAVYFTAALRREKER